MNYDFLKQKMDRYFNETSPEVLVENLEKRGYIFIDAKCKYEPIVTYNTQLKKSLEEKQNRSWFSKLFKSQNNNDNLDNIEVFLCKLAL
jgi:hypothetical protein